MPTVSEIRTLFQGNKYIDAVEDSIVWMWLTAINQESYKIMYESFPDKYAFNTDLVLVDGTSEYTFVGMGLTTFKTLDANGCGLYKLNDNGSIFRDYPYTKFGSNETGFYLGDDKIVMTPEPSGADTLTFRAIPVISVPTGNASDLITSDADSMIVPDGFNDLILEELNVKYDKREEEDPGLISVSQQFAGDFRDRFLNNFTQKRRRVYSGGNNRRITQIR